MPDLAQISLMSDVLRKIRDAGSGVAGVARRLRRQLSDAGDQTPGDKQARTSGYLRFQDAASEALVSLHLSGRWERRLD